MIQQRIPYKKGVENLCNVPLVTTSHTEMGDQIERAAIRPLTPMDSIVQPVKADAPELGIETSQVSEPTHQVASLLNADDDLGTPVLSDNKLFILGTGMLMLWACNVSWVSLYSFRVVHWH